MDFPILSQRQSTSQNDNTSYFPFYKTKLLKSARKKDSHENSILINANLISSEKDMAFNIPLASHMQAQTPTEKSLDFTPSRDHETATFSEQKERVKDNFNEKLQKYKEKIQELETNEQKLKSHVKNLLEVNSKLTLKLKEKENENFANNVQSNSQNKVLSNNSNVSNLNGKEPLEKQLRDCMDERDYLHDKVINLNQKIEAMTKKDAYKEKMLDFYQNRIKLYQFKLENYPKNEKEQIKYLEDYIMALLGENSKLNRALEKSEMESKKWQEKYFDFEKAKEVLVTYESNNKQDKINNVGHKNYNANNILEKEGGSSASKKDDIGVWGCRPRHK